MVLQDLDDTPQDSFNDTPYPSENDPYSSPSSSSTSGGRFDASSLPQPIPILGPFLGFSEAAVRFKTESTIKFAERRVHRSLYPEESQALASHLYQLEQTKSYFTAVGAGIGAWRWYKTMEQCRYPLYLPKPENINPNKFLFVKGPMAQYARHSWRLLLYMFVAGELGKLLGQITGQPIAAQNTANDPKLAQFAADLRNSIASDTTRARGAGSQQKKEWDDMITRERAAKEHARRDSPLPGAQQRRPWTPPQKPAASGDDDMSPIAGSDPWAPMGDSSWGDSGYSDQTQSTQPRQQRASRPSDDDASPTGGMFQDEVRDRSRPGESAWDRLRRGGAPGSAQQRPQQGGREPPHREQREGSTSGDSFAFAESDEERKRAQERARREFDARIARERQGKDFNDDSKKW
ncbi:hypothetical protein BU26DRAFT_512876 [Trematosphaeria pertusa]|uniref:Uncharacterized protein n=1 Tax=Trematosphaeria pertusa TaxID=390896 RepID=A0A6A6IZE0_9PLEO|nr:uncharacterized protein BU26DRAFT_512876 [Trematosphaeria pertusa]KAF2255935.1 hypothetical protein BU26DRAFT_512876 [Trematosphaeria pertusa]